MVAHKCTPLRNILRTQSDSDIERGRSSAESGSSGAESGRSGAEAAAVERRRPQWSGSGRTASGLAAVERRAAAVELRATAQRWMSVPASSNIT